MAGPALPSSSSMSSFTDSHLALIKSFLSIRLENELCTNLMNHCNKQKNDAHSLYELGRLYQFGLGSCEIDLHKAKSYFDEAIKYDHPTAMYNLCQLYGNKPSASFVKIVSEGELIEIKVRWYLKSSAQALVYSKAGVELWNNYNSSLEWRTSLIEQRRYLLDKISKSDYKDLKEFGDILNQVSYIALQLSKDDDGYKTAIDGFQSAIKLGNSAACWNLAALVYHNCLGVQPDEAKKLQLMYQAANEGHVRAQLWIGEHLFTPTIGKEKQCEEAISYFKRSLLYTFASTLYWIGYAHLLGVGTTKDYALALQYFRLAVISTDYVFGNGRSLSCSWLAFMYSKGLGVHVDYTTASHYYAMSIKLGNRHSFNDLARLVEKRKISQCDVETAVKLYNLGAGEDVKDTSTYYPRYRLGKIYSNRDYVELYNKAKSTEYFRQALRMLESSLDDKTRPYRYYHLGIMYEKGYGTVKSDRRAIQYYDQAIRRAESVYDTLDRYYGKKAKDRRNKISQSATDSIQTIV